MLACRLHGVHGTIGGRTAVPSDVFLALTPRTLLLCGSDVETQLRAGQMHDRKPLTFPKALMAKLRQPEAPAPAAPAPAPPAPAPLPTSSLLDIHGAAQQLLVLRPAMPAAPGLLLQQAVEAVAAAAPGFPGVPTAAAPPFAAAAGAAEPQPGMRRKRAVSGPAPAEPTAKAFRSAQHGVAGADGSITGWAAQPQAPADWDHGPDGANGS